ncbi:VCBS repeat-containing protein [Streptomyces sp. NPDC050738]|uniref:FG-GAP repeat domain-containing protein n=1 Tax=Streptomyces sp. NPDC050738 TaxID=3154744 RepID=UPI0034413825
MIFAHRRRALKRALTTTAIAATLAATAGTATAADHPTGAEKARAEAVAKLRATSPLAAPRSAAAGQVQTPTFSMDAVEKTTQELYLYFPDRAGGFDARYDVGVTYEFATASISIDNDKDGYSDGSWTIDKSGLLTYTNVHMDPATRDIGTGWTTYTKVLSPGDLGGTTEADLMGVDKTGVLWTYVGHSTGLVDARVRIGSGWDAYTEIAGQSDLSGDGKADIVARDKAGALWLYKGTGDIKAPFEPRTKVGTGWNAYNRLLSVGDLDADGRTDLVARSTTGDLFRYSGTGDAAAPFAKPVKIGWGYNIYNLL